MPSSFESTVVSRFSSPILYISVITAVCENLLLDCWAMNLEVMVLGSCWLYWIGVRNLDRVRYVCFLIVLNMMIDMIYVILDAETGAASTNSASNFRGTQYWKNQFQSFWFRRPSCRSKSLEGLLCKGSIIFFFIKRKSKLQFMYVDFQYLQLLLPFLYCFCSAASLIL